MTQPKVSGSRKTKSPRVVNEYVKKQKVSSAFTRSTKVVATPKPKIKISPLKINNKSKVIKKSTKQVKKSANKSREVVALQKEIAQINREIEIASKKTKPTVIQKKSIDKRKPTHSKTVKPAQSSLKSKLNTRVKSEIKSLSMKVKSKSKKGKNPKSKVKSTAKPETVHSSKKTAVNFSVKTRSNKVSVGLKLNASKCVADSSVKTTRPKISKESKMKLKRKNSDLAKNSVVDKSKPNKKRKLSTTDEDEGNKVAYIHVGSGEGQRYLSDHLRGSSQVNIQVLSTENLPDIDYSDMIHGLDHAGTSRDYVDEGHRCTVRCPVGCQGHLRPNELVIYESVRHGGRLLERRRIKGRFVEGDPGDQVVSALQVTDFRRVSGRGRLTERNRRRRMENQRAYRRTMAEDRNDAPILPVPTRIGVSSGMPQRVGILLDTPAVTREVAEEHSWNINDRSFNIVLKQDDPLTMRRHPVAQSTDCIRGKIGYSSGIHLWEVTWPVRQRGTHAVVGVATREAVLHCVGYQSLVGNTEHSWGWDLGRKKAYHNSTANGGTNYPPTITHHHQWTVPDRFFMILDMDIGSLGYALGDQFLGWSHTGIKNGERLFPVVSTVWGHCEVKLRYMGGLEGGVVGLKELARSVIRNALSRNSSELAEQLESLGLPTRLRKYLKYEW